MNYLTIVNKVLVRLREDTVSAVMETPYSQLIGEFVNTTKREVEDAWNWFALTDTNTISTSPNVATYSLVGAQTRAKVIEVMNTSTDSYLEYKPASWLSEKFLVGTPQTGEPKYYGFNGVDVNGDLQIELYPVPNTNYFIDVNLVKPQADLVSDNDTLLVPFRIVIEGAVSKAISERGDDGGYTEQENRYILALGDAIANEANLRPEEITWGAT